MAIFKESAPHLRRKASVTRMMVDVLIALAPSLIFAFIAYPLTTLAFYLTSVFIIGGPMMGNAVPSDDIIITKTVTSIIVLDKTNDVEQPCVRCVKTYKTFQN